MRARRERRGAYLVAVAGSGAGVFLIWPFLATVGWHVIWSGPSVPVLGVLDLTWEELRLAAVYALRLVGVSLAFTAYALLVDHDRLVAGAGFARRSALAVALATRLVPTLERDAAGFAEALRGRGVAVAGIRGHARLLSPLVAGSLERATNLAEAMEARGFGRPERTRAPSPRWTELDRAALAGSAALLTAAVLWL
jgi:energy-coupling factor transport system permease protein